MSNQDSTAEAKVVAIRKVPVVTSISPDWQREVLGTVAAELSTAEPWPEVVDKLEAMISQRAIEKFNGAARVCHNFSWTMDAEPYGWRHYTYRATADVYGEEINE